MIITRTKDVWLILGATLLLAAWMPHGKQIVSSFTTTYYICPTGSDSNDGLTTLTPWQTIGKATATSLTPNTAILLCGTDTFNVTSPAPSNTTGAVTFVKARASGTAGNPIVVDVYNGSTATISDNGTGYTFMNTGAPYFEVHNLTLTSTTAVRGIFFFTQTTNDTLSGVVITGNTVLGYKGNGVNTSNGIQIAGSTVSNTGWTGWQITNNLIDGSTGSMDQGIFINGSAKNANGVIQGNIVHDVYGNDNTAGGQSGNGIQLSQVTTALVQYNLTYNLGRNTITCGGPAGQWTFQSTGITIQYAEAYGIYPNIAQATSQTYDAGTGHVTITFGAPYNIVVGRIYNLYNTSPVLWSRNYTALAGSNSTTLIAAIGVNPGTATQFGKVVPAGCDWDGFDLDNQVSNSTIQYTYSHDNFGGGQIMFFTAALSAQWHDNTYRYNVMETMTNVESNQSVCYIVGTNGSATVVNANIYNNTCWIKAGGKGINFLTNTTGMLFANNIFVSDAGQYYIYAPFQNLPTNSLFLNNDYWTKSGSFTILWNNPATYASLAAWQATGQETISASPVGSSANPLLVGGGSSITCSWTPSSANSWPPGSNCPSSYELQHSSTMIGSGLDLTQAPYSLSVGTRDYYGDAIPNGVGTGYNIGADGAAR